MTHHHTRATCLDECGALVSSSSSEAAPPISAPLSLAPGPSLSWIRLDQPKDWSRILYPSPVCFLTTCCSNENTSTAASSSCSLPRHNVMVISWLTAANNGGRILLSMNKSRHSCHVLRRTKEENHQGDCEFGLCVPVHGMQNLIRQVGTTSGRWGRSKFPQDYHRTDKEVIAYQYQEEEDDDDDDNDDGTTTISRKHPSQKRVHQQHFPNGIPGLQRVTMGSDMLHPDGVTHDDGPMAIAGTVAHVRCQVAGMLADVVDADHVIVVADIVDAHIRSDYWDGRCLAPTRADLPPYLTFLGSQRFGVVVPSSSGE